MLDLIADKWSVLVLGALMERTHRHSELRRRVEGISQKMLTQTLRNLERNGIVHREIYPEVPPRVEHSLTPLGETLREPIGALCAWAQNHVDELLQEASHRATQPTHRRLSPQVGQSD